MLSASSTFGSLIFASGDRRRTDAMPMVFPFQERGRCLKANLTSDRLKSSALKGGRQTQSARDSVQAFVPGPERSVRRKPRRGKQVRIDIADSMAMQRLLIDEAEHFGIVGNRRLR